MFGGCPTTGPIDPDQDAYRIAEARSWLEFSRGVGQSYVDRGKIKQSELDAVVIALQAGIEAWEAKSTGTVEDRAEARAKIQQAILLAVLAFVDSEDAPPKSASPVSD